MQKRLLKKGIAGVLAGVLCATLFFPGDAAKAESKKLDLNGTYHAALGLQTCTQVWINRFAYYDKEANKYYGTADADKMLAGDPSGNGADYACEFQDAEIKGNGTYTVKVTGADFAGETDISQLHVATDIPLNDTIKFTDVSFSIDGKKIAGFDQGYMEDEEPYLGGGMDLLLINHWRDGLVKDLAAKGVTESVENGYALLQGTTGEEISVTFTVSGFSYDNPETVATEEPTSTPQAAKDASSEDQESKGSAVVPIVVGVAVVAVVCGGIVIIHRKKK